MEDVEAPRIDEVGREAKVFSFAATILLAYQTLGVLYGDIGTSPLCFLFILFFCQRFGTDKVSIFFSPIMLLWFTSSTHGSIGIYNIIKYYPSPHHLYCFFKTNGKGGWEVLGAVFMCITGAEAMFADLGHFNKTSIPLKINRILIVLFFIVFFSIEVSYMTSPLVKVPRGGWVSFAIAAFFLTIMLYRRNSRNVYEVATSEDFKVGVEKYIGKQGLKKKVLREGECTDFPDNGDEVEVHYVGTLLDGTKFDSSHDRGTPFKFILGQGKVMEGLDQGIKTMKKGETALFTVPSELLNMKLGWKMTL